MISDDLVNSYHLLLCALDLVYGNALQCSNRKELVNPNFKGKLVNQDYWTTHTYTLCLLLRVVVQVSENITDLRSSIIVIQGLLINKE